MLKNVRTGKIEVFEMLKEDLIKKLQEIPGNPEIFVEIDGRYVAVTGMDSQEFLRRSTKLLHIQKNLEMFRDNKPAISEEDFEKLLKKCPEEEFEPITKFSQNYLKAFRENMESKQTVIIFGEFEKGFYDE
jgi:hypothetical protein